MLVVRPFSALSSLPVEGVGAGEAGVGAVSGFVVTGVGVSVDVVVGVGAGSCFCSAAVDCVDSSEGVGAGVAASVVVSLSVGAPGGWSGLLTLALCLSACAVLFADVFDVIVLRCVIVGVKFSTEPDLVPVVAEPEVDASGVVGGEVEGVVEEAAAEEGEASCTEVLASVLGVEGLLECC